MRLNFPEDEAVFCTRVCFDQLSPPSVDLATISESAFDPTLGPPLKLPKHRYTLPKLGLELALSAQICSLSANAAELLDAGMMTGADHAFLSPCAAARALSVLDTPMPSTPL